MKNKILRLTDGSIDMNKMSKEELEALKERTEEVHLNFTKLTENLDISSDKYKVLLVLGENELIYNDGEFYVGETLSPENKRKISKQRAQQIFVDYYSRYHIKAKIKEDVDKKVVNEKEIEKDKVNVKEKVKEDDAFER